MINKIRRLHLIGCTLACVLFTPALQATIQHLPGTTVDFYYEDTQPGLAVYGGLMAVGDSIFATPTAFFAEALDGATASLPVSATVTVVAKSGYEFDLVQVAQRGDYILSGTGTSVSVSSDLDVTDANNASTTVNSILGSTSDFTQTGTNLWSSGTSVDLSTAMWNGVMSIDLTLNTLLTATTTGSQQQAKIQVKQTAGGLATIMTTPIPVPPAIWLFATGLALLYRQGRRS